MPSYGNKHNSAYVNWILRKQHNVCRQQLLKIHNHVFGYTFYYYSHFDIRSFLPLLFSAHLYDVCCDCKNIVLLSLSAITERSSHILKPEETWRQIKCILMNLGHVCIWLSGIKLPQIIAMFILRPKQNGLEPGVACDLPS